MTTQHVISFRVRVARFDLLLVGVGKKSNFLIQSTFALNQSI